MVLLGFLNPTGYIPIDPLDFSWLKVPTVYLILSGEIIRFARVRLSPNLTLNNLDLSGSCNMVLAWERVPIITFNDFPKLGVSPTLPHTLLFFSFPIFAFFFAFFVLW